MKPQCNTSTIWSPELAYAIGLIVTDGNLSPDERHISFTSKDEELINHFIHCLHLHCKVYKKSSGSVREKCYYVAQFSDVNFYRFLLDIGLMSRKTKIVGKLEIPKKYFFDFLRGHFDGDGCFYSYWDPRWPSSHMFYISFASASLKHLHWLQARLKEYVNIHGHITHSKAASCYQLKFAKRESRVLISKIYYKKSLKSLTRKRLKINSALAIIAKPN